MVYEASISDAITRDLLLRIVIFFYFFVYFFFCFVDDYY